MDNDNTDAPEAADAPEGEERETKSFFGAAFDKLKADGKFDFDALPDGEEKEDKTVEDAPEKEVAAVVPEKKDESFDAGDVLGLNADDEPAADEPVAEPAEDLSTPSGKAFAKLRKEAKEKDALIKELRESQGSSPELESLKAKVTEYEALISEQEQSLTVTKLESTRAFKEAVTVPRKQLTEAVKVLAAKVDGVTESEILAALADPESDAITEVAAHFSDRDRMRLYQFQDEYTRIQNTERVARENAAEANRRIEAQETEQSTQSKKARKEAIDKEHTAFRNLIGEKLPFMQKHEGKDAWNAKIDEADAWAKHAVELEDYSPRDRAELVNRAAITPLVIELLTALTAQHKATLAKVAKYEKVKGNLGEGAPAAGAAAAAIDDDDDAGFREILHKRIN